MRRLGYHRQRPARSAACRAKPQIVALERRLAAARRTGDAATIASLESEHARLLCASLSAT